jgi:hypothetical protein
MLDEPWEEFLPDPEYYQSEEILYDFWYVAVKTAKGPEWILETFSLYRVDTSIDGIKIGIVNSQLELFDVIERLEHILVGEGEPSEFPVFGNGASLEECLLKVAEQKDFLVQYDYTMVELSSEKARVESEKIKSIQTQREVNRYEWIDSVTCNVKSISLLGKVLTSKFTEHEFERLIKHCLKTYVRMTPIMWNLSELILWFSEFCLGQVPHAFLVNKSEGIRRQRTKHCEQFNHELKDTSNRHSVCDRWITYWRKELEDFVPSIYHLPADRARFEATQLSHVIITINKKYLCPNYNKCKCPYAPALLPNCLTKYFKSYFNRYAEAYLTICISNEVIIALTNSDKASKLACLNHNVMVIISGIFFQL